jgi:hypothetical protein
VLRLVMVQLPSLCSVASIAFLDVAAHVVPTLWMIVSLAASWARA